jgi:hypothetical protein
VWGALGFDPLGKGGLLTRAIESIDIIEGLDGRMFPFGSRERAQKMGLADTGITPQVKKTMLQINRIGRIIGQINAPERRHKGYVIANDKVI